MDEKAVVSSGSVARRYVIDPIVVDVQSGKAGRWWHLSYGVRSWPPLPIRPLGIPAYVAVCEAERFVVN